MSKEITNKNALSNIMNQCQTRLQELYPATIPSIAKERYESELSYLKESQYINDFEIFRLLSNQAQKCSSFITIRGTLSGSYIIYLLDSSHWNPLPVHYYCPNCGTVEIADTSLFSFDLPEKKCPNCSHPIYADGYNLPIESVWGIDGKKLLSFEYNISASFLPFARKALEQMYSNHAIVPYGVFTKGKNSSIPSMEHTGFAILPSDQSIDDYPDYQGYLEDGELCLTCSLMDLQYLPIKRITLLPNKVIDLILDMQNSTGVFFNDITNGELKELSWNNIANTYILEPTADYLLHTYKPRTFTKLCELTAASHNTYENVPQIDLKFCNYDLINWLNSDTYSMCKCSTREDFFDTLIQSNYSTENAFIISELIRKGRANRAPDTLEQYKLPLNIMDTAKNCLYLFPRSHIVEYMFTYYRLAYYVKHDSKIYRRIINKHN